MLKTAKTFNKNNYSRQGFMQKGLSLIEASMVLVLSAIVVSGTIAYFETASDNNKLNKTTEEIMHIMSEVKGSFVSTDNGYQGVDVPTLLTLMPEFSSKMIIPSTGAGKPTPVILLPYPDSYTDIKSGEFDQNTNKFTTNSNNQFQLSMQNIPLKLCLRIMGFNYGASLVAKGGMAATGLFIPSFIKPNASMQDVVSLCDALDKQAPSAGFRRRKASFFLIFQ